jgi:hypothetical protein
VEEVGKDVVGSLGLWAVGRRRQVAARGGFADLSVTHVRRRSCNVVAHRLAKECCSQ